jgi:hypothetical protein
LPSKAHSALPLPPVFHHPRLSIGVLQNLLTLFQRFGILYAKLPVLSRAFVFSGKTNFFAKKTEIIPDFLDFPPALW